ncbi:hypothetical protein PI124_g3999 [Phytophthora idaei]|nr:hypothetical protein PI124_g3999 [Phytophthora idaei]
MKDMVVDLVSSDDGGDDTDQRALYVPNRPRLGDFARYSDQAAQSATTSGSANAFFSTEPAVIDLVSTDDSGEDAENTQIGSNVVTVSVGDHHESHLGDAAEDGDGVMDAVKLEAELEAMEAVNTILKRTETYKDVAKRGKKMQSKNNPQQQPKSRRRRYQTKRKPMKSSTKSTKIYYLPTIQAAFLQGFETLPDLVERLRTQYRETDKGTLDDETTDNIETEESSAPDYNWDRMMNCDVENIDLESKTPAPDSDNSADITPEGWPQHLQYLTRCINNKEISFIDTGSFDPCECALDCVYDECNNSASAYYCTPTSCALNGRCSNSIYAHSGVRITPSRHGLGLVATENISIGEFIGEYTGKLTMDNINMASVQNDGGKTRFTNHSCQPNCLFVKMRNHRRVVIVIAPISAGEEITVRYGSNLWFDCTCNKPNYVGPMRPGSHST